MMQTRWPLHPQPQEGECLSSWLRRIAKSYAVNVADLVEHELQRPHNANLLDRFPPKNLLEAVSLRTGVPLEKVRRTTFVGLISTLTDSAKCNEYSIFLAPTPYRGKSICWLRKECSNLACRSCLDNYPDAGILLAWRLSITQSCPLHGTMLEPGLIEKNNSVRWLNRNTIQAPRLICALDSRNYAALSEGYVELAGGRIHAALWFSLLKVILDELTRRTNPRNHSSPAHMVRAEAATFLQDMSWNAYPNMGTSMLLANAIDMMEKGIVSLRGEQASLFCRQTLPKWSLFGNLVTESPDCIKV